MGTEDEFRKVGEDVRALARTLRHELKGAQWEAKQAARQARDEIRQEYRAYRRSADPRLGPRPHAGRHSRPQWDVSGRSDGGPQTATGYAGPPAWIPRPPAPPRTPRPPKPPKAVLPPVRHRRDGSTLLSLLLVLIGLAWLVSQTRIFSVSLEAVLAAALALLGAGMVVTARTDWSLSRRAWPMWAGITLLVMVMISSNSAKISNSFSNMSVGPVKMKPTSWADLHSSVRNFAGLIRLDLSSLQGTPPTAQTVLVRNTFGPVDINLPTTLKYHVHILASLWAGSIQLPPDASVVETGSNQKTADLGTGEPTLTLDLQTRAGPITVSEGFVRSSSPVPTPPDPPNPPA